MIEDHQIHYKGNQILLGIATSNAVMDILTTENLIQNCIKLLSSTHQGALDTLMGYFGPHEITLNIHHDDTISIFIDGPNFEQGQYQSSAIWVDKDGLRRILEEAISQ